MSKVKNYYWDEIIEMINEDNDDFIEEFFEVDEVKGANGEVK